MFGKEVSWGLRGVREPERRGCYPVGTMWRKCPAVLILIAAMPACATISQSPGLAQFDHELFYGIDDNPVELSVPLSGGVYSSGTVDARVHPRLAEAWEAGKEPSYPLIGRQPAMWLRELSVTPMIGSGGKVKLETKALFPHPVRLTLLAIEDGRPATLSQTNSESWSTGIHFATMAVDYQAFAGTVIIIRVEGAHQATETLVELVPGS